jgi:hypothetical protein
MLTVVDDFAGVKRIETMLQTLDVGPAFKPEPCGPPPPIGVPREGPVREAPPAPPAR